MEVYSECSVSTQMCLINLIYIYMEGSTKENTFELGLKK